MSESTSGGTPRQEEHADTVELMHAVKYEQAYMFAYSMRDKTAAARHLAGGVEGTVQGCKGARVRGCEGARV